MKTSILRVVTLPNFELRFNLTRDGWVLEYGPHSYGPFPAFHSPDPHREFDEIVVDIWGLEGEERAAVRREIIKLTINHQDWARRYGSYSGPTVAEEPKKEGEKGEKPSPANVVPRHIDQVNPAFDLIPGNPSSKLCITLPLTCKVTKKVKKTDQGLEEVTVEELVPVIVLSDGKGLRERYVANKENIRKLGIRTYTKPVLPQQRWSEEGSNRWYEGHPGSFPDKGSVYRAVRGSIEHYMDLPERSAYSFIALWVMGTYFYQLFETYPYVAVNGVRNSGKSKLMLLCLLFSFNGILTADLTAPGLFRASEGLKATLIFDEAERLSDRERLEAFLSISNSGYRKGVKVLRANKDTMVLEWFDTYCPKMYGGIREMEEVLASRTIPFTLLRTLTEKGNLELKANPDNPEWQSVREMLYCCQLNYWPEVMKAYDETVNSFGLMNRDWQLWRPIFALARWLGDQRLQAEMNTLARLKSMQRKTMDELVDETVLLRALWKNVVCPEWYKVSVIKEEMAELYGEDNVPQYLNGSYVGKLLRRQNWTQIRKHGREYHITPEEVKDRCKRLGITFEEDEGKSEP